MWLSDWERNPFPSPHEIHIIFFYPWNTQFALENVLDFLFTFSSLIFPVGSKIHTYVKTFLHWNFHISSIFIFTGKINKNDLKNNMSLIKIEQRFILRFWSMTNNRKIHREIFHFYLHSILYFLFLLIFFKFFLQYFLRFSSNLLWFTRKNHKTFFLSIFKIKNKKQMRSRIKLKKKSTKLYLYFKTVINVWVFH